MYAVKVRPSGHPVKHEVRCAPLGDHGNGVRLGLFSPDASLPQHPSTPVDLMAKLCPTCGNSYDDRNVFCPSDGSTLRTSGDASDLVGSVIADRYLITEKLGQGGMGRVYLAQHVRLPQQAAIKVLHPTLVHDTDALARFNHEASNACRINDSHVARVYDFGETGTGLVYLAMEYVPGETLNELLRTGAPFAPLRAAALTRQIAGGLDAAHKLGIVHRDLKPDNILVTRDTDGEELVKVVDFGIAKAMDTTTQHVTKTGFVLGTAHYMSPEQVSGRIVDRRSDVYALGLVAFMMLTGKLPFPAETAEEAMVKRLTDAPRTLAEMRDDVPWPAEVQQVFDGALAREIEGRYPTAGAFAKALSEAIDNWQRPQSAPAPRAVAAPPRPAPVGAGRASAAGSATHAATTAPARPVWRFALFGGGAVVAGIAAVLLISNGGGAESTDGGGAPTTVASGDSSAGAGAGAVSPPANPVAPNVGGGQVPPPSPGQVSTPSRPQGGGRSGDAGTPVRPASPITGGADRAVADGAAAVAELDKLLAQLSPDSIDVTSDRDQAIARATVRSLRDLLPRLPTAHDSLKAELGRANAHFFLQEIETACAVLRAYLPRASALARTEIEDMRERFGCP